MRNQLLLRQNTRPDSPVYEFRRITRVEQLAEHLDAWHGLVKHAEEANIFYEPGQLVPALSHLRDDLEVELVLVYEKRHGSPMGLLCGLFPLEKAQPHKWLPLRYYRLWKHRYCFLTTPLVRRGRVTETLDAFVGWLEAASEENRYFSWGSIGGDGAIASELMNVVQQRGWLAGRSSHQRAMLARMEDPEAHLRSAFTSKRYREYGRMERRLQELGSLVYEKLDEASDVDGWIRDFLELESSGWKGKAGTALNCHDPDRAYFTAIAKAAHQGGNLSFYRLRLDGQSIAAVCEFKTGEMGFSFKAAYRESHAHMKPMMLLELWHIRNLGEISAGLVDSCADPGHAILDKVWPERRTITTLKMTKDSPVTAILLKVRARLRKGGK